MSFDRSNLSTFPRPQSSLIGRAAETAAIHQRLAQPNARLLTLTGPGGIGKTRLALHAALTAPGFEDGRWFVELVGLTEPALILPQIAQVLGLQQRGDAPVRDQIVALLSGRDILLVLDNFEHLLDGATTLSQLLSQAPGFKILTTSRAPLNLAQEIVIPIGPLETARAGGDAGHPEAVELFLQRSRAIRAGYDPGAADLQAIAEICAELAGLPLAIELAAARMRIMAPRALHSRLAQPLRLLSAGPHDAPIRHRSMRDAIDWSYKLLPDQQRSLLRVMGAFAGSVPLDGLEAVTAAPDSANAGETIELAARLVDASMIEAIERESPEPRFLVYATVREFARDELVAAGELDAVRDRHAAWVEQLTTNFEPEFSGPREHLAQARMRDDLDNIRAALARLLEVGDLPRAARIIGNLWAFWSFGGQSGEGRRWVDRLLPRLTEGALPPEDERSFFLSAGLVAWAQGDAAIAAERYQRALELAQQLDQPRWQADAFMWLSQAAWYAGDYESMRRYARETFPFQPVAPVAVACAHTLAGIAEMRLDELDAAQHELALARAQHERTGFVRGSIWTLQLLADLALLRGDLTASARDHRASLALALESQNRWGVFEDLSGLIAIALKLGWTREALELLASAELLLTSSSVLPREGSWLSESDRAALRSATDPGDVQRLARNAAALTLPELVARASEIARAIEETPQTPSATAEPRPIPPRNAPAASFDLSPREQEVLALLVQGLTDRQIADALFISHGTARSHVAHVLAKLDARNRAVAVRKALEFALV